MTVDASGVLSSRLLPVVMSFPIVLASASPRRKELLRFVFSDFTVIPSHVDESEIDGMLPDAVPALLARLKSEAVAETIENGLIIGADTVVILEQEVLNKPETPALAVEMLLKLSGRKHRVVTGVSLVFKKGDTLRATHFSSTTSVYFGKLTEEQIAAYVATESPLDKAGAYGIQDPQAACFIQKIEGDFYNVVGFPVFDFYHHCKTFYPECF